MNKEKKEQIKSLECLIRAAEDSIDVIAALMPATNEELEVASKLISEKIKAIQKTQESNSQNVHKYGLLFAGGKKIYDKILDKIAINEIYHLTQHLTYCHQIIYARKAKQEHKLIPNLEEKIELMNSQLTAIKNSPDRER